MGTNVHHCNCIVGNIAHSYDKIETGAGLSFERTKDLFYTQEGEKRPLNLSRNGHVLTSQVETIYTFKGNRSRSRFYTLPNDKRRSRSRASSKIKKVTILFAITSNAQTSRGTTHRTLFHPHRYKQHKSMGRLPNRGGKKWKSAFRIAYSALPIITYK
jgi:hypothetical protein